MGADENWVQAYKTEHECDEHWQLRQSFLLAHKDKFPEERLVCLAQVFTNVEFLGCRYPEKTMQLVAELSKEVAASYREKQKTRLQRTFVKASDAAGAKVKGLKRPSEQELPSSANDAAPVSEKKDQSSSDICSSPKSPPKKVKLANPAPTIEAAEKSDSKQVSLELTSSVPSKNEIKPTSATEKAPTPSAARREAPELPKQELPASGPGKTAVNSVHQTSNSVEPVSTAALNSQVPENNCDPPQSSFVERKITNGPGSAVPERTFTTASGTVKTFSFSHYGAVRTYHIDKTQSVVDENPCKDVEVIAIKEVIPSTPPRNLPPDKAESLDTVNRTSLEKNSTSFEKNSTSFEKKNTSFEKNSTSFEKKNTSFEKNSTSFEKKNTSFEKNSTSFEKKNASFEKKVSNEWTGWDELPTQFGKRTTTVSRASYGQVYDRRPRGRTSQSRRLPPDGNWRYDDMYSYY